MGKFRKPSLSLVLVVFFCLAATVGAVSAYMQISTNKNVNLTVANDNGVRFQGPNIPTNTYNFFSASQSATMGLNALHIASSNDTSDVYGTVNQTTNTSGTFYLTDTGGRGWDDDGILMIAVNGTIPDDFTIHIDSAGYQWTPVPTGEHPTYNNSQYTQGIDETFDTNDFTGDNGYISTWKPCPATNYPLYEGQDVAQDTSNNNTFHIIFVDLYAGIIGQNTLSSWGQAVNNGALQVNYTISNLPSNSMVAFDDYAYCQSSNQGNGIRWTNSVNTITGLNNSQSTSGWDVASWF